MARIGYIRVSSEGQNLDRQEDLVAPNVDVIFREKASGGDTNRPELQKVLSYIRGRDIVYIESVSRLARSTKELLGIVEEFRSKKVGLVSFKENIDTETPQGRFIFQIFAALSELERESVKQRQREGIDAARRRGKDLGRPKTALPKDFQCVINEWKAGKITAVEARKRLGLAHATFYTLVKSEKSIGNIHASGIMNAPIRAGVFSGE